MSLILTKSISTIGKWTQNKAVDFKKVLEYYKDVIVKGREVFADFSQVSRNVTETNNVSQCTTKQYCISKWMPPLKNFRSTLKGDAAKLILQHSYRNNSSANSFFRNNILWRQARKGHLIAFAGLFLFQEENQELKERFHNQYQIYENICKNIQNIFRTFEDKEALLRDNEIGLDQFQLGKVMRTSDKTVTFDSQLLPEEDDIISCSSSDFFDETNSCQSIVPSDDHLFTEPVLQDFAVKAILPDKGVQKISSVLKNCEHELLCGGINFREIHGFGLRNGIANVLPSHPNILKIKRVFCDHLPRLEMDPRGCVDRTLNQAIYLVTRRYEHTLRSYLEEKRFEPHESVLVIAQLLEAVAHLERHNVVHRDINAENIHLDFDKDGYPRIVLGEFEKAYCAASTKEMKIPFQHPSLDTRVKDLSSQAPEVSTATAGRFRSVDYTKSDAWMAGCVAYEVLTGRNPFREPNNDAMLLDSRTYKQKDLHDLRRADVSDSVKIVIEMLLARDPKKRLSGSEAADILHLELFATPLHQWLCEDTKCEELRRWLSNHCAEVMARKRNSSVPFEMCQCFFNRLDSHQLAIANRFWVSMRNAKSL